MSKQKLPEKFEMDQGITLESLTTV